MSSFIVLERVVVEDANCITGFTHGFPAMSHFLGFTHHLSRKLQQKGLSGLNACAVFCHQQQQQVYRYYADVKFVQNKKSAVALKGYGSKAKDMPPIIEEGKMNMVISLVMACAEDSPTRSDFEQTFKEAIANQVYQQRMAGGTIQQIKKIHVLSHHDITKLTTKLKRIIMPAFMLIDRSDLLAQHHNQRQSQHPDAELLDSWLDFFKLIHQAKPILKEKQTEADVNAKTEANWEIQPRSYSGWLVPITNGYKSISALYPAGEVANARDNHVPFCFVEATHSIGEWRSVHRLININDALWHYQYQPDWYLCQAMSDSDITRGEISNEGIDDYFSHH